MAKKRRKRRPAPAPDAAAPPPTPDAPEAPPPDAATPDGSAPRASRRQRLLLWAALLAVPCLLLAKGLLGFHRFLVFEEGSWTPSRLDYTGFVQDDAFISLRYSRNLAAGHGLVFNPGVRTEGYTNPLWTIGGGVASLAGLPEVRVWQAVGVLAALVLLGLVLAVVRARAGTAWGLTAASLVAVSPTLHAWAGSGLESSFFAALLFGALAAAQRDRPRLAFGLLAVAQWTRPEAPLVAGAVLWVLTAERPVGAAARTRRRRLWYGVGVYLASLAALLMWRQIYYGSWVPNTYLVKAGGNAASHLLGLRKLEELAGFQGNLALWIGLILGLLPDLSPADPRARGWRRLLPRPGPWAVWVAGFLALGAVDVWLNDQGFWRSNLDGGGWSLLVALGEGDWRGGWALLSALLGATGASVVLAPGDLRSRRVLRIAALVWVGYLYYFVRVGGDLLPMHRLFLPALGFQATAFVLAVRRGAGPHGLGGWIERLAPAPERGAEVRGALVGLTAVALVLVGVRSLAFSASQGHYKTVTQALDACHGEAGRDLEALARRHGFRPRVLAQDMGMLPVSAPSCDFIDAIGLTERPIARILYRHGYSPYFRYLVWDSEEIRRDILAMEEELRAHLSEEVRPEYVVINAHIPNEKAIEAREAAAQGDGEFFQPYLVENSFFYRWPETPYFRENYVFERAYEYSHVHYMVTLRRRDQPELPEAGA